MNDVIIDYIKALVNLYGLVSKEKIVEIFNMQNDDKIVADDIDKIVTSKTLDNEIFEYSEGHFIEESLLVDDDLEKLLKRLGNKPYYIPEKSELLKYADQLYYQETQELENLKAFIKKEIIINDEQMADELCDDIQIFAGCMSGSMDIIMYQFERRNIILKTEKQARDLMPLIIEVKNNTRVWENRGYTPKEMHGRTDETDIHQTKKVGRNDQCPCGSGKKYKHCCGSN